MGKSKVGMIVGALVVILVIGFIVKHKKDQSAAEPKIDELVKNCDQDRKELSDLYQQRIQFLLNWQKAASSSMHGIPPELVVAPEILHSTEFIPNTEADFNRMDNIQNELGEEITHYLQNKAAMKVRPPGLEKLEESINRKRHDYHVNAFEANALIESSGVKHDLIPVFGAEKVLKQQGMWK